MPVTCSECKKTISNSRVLANHLRKIHNKEPPPIIEPPFPTKYACIDCNINFKFNNILRQHLEANHNFENIVEELHFENYSDFTEWLSEEQNINKVQYVKATGNKKATCGYKKMYFECKRSRINRNQQLNKNRKRKIKAQGSCKMETSCVSQIVVYRNETTDECTVAYYKSHYMHEADVEHLQISKKDKDMIASKLLTGVSSKTILNLVRETANGDVKRLHLLTNKDIRNIKVAYNMEKLSSSELQAVPNNDAKKRIKSEPQLIAPINDTNEITKEDNSIVSIKAEEINDGNGIKEEVITKNQLNTPNNGDNEIKEKVTIKIIPFNKANKIKAKDKSRKQLVTLVNNATKIQEEGSVQLMTPCTNDINNIKKKIKNNYLQTLTNLEKHIFNHEQLKSILENSNTAYALSQNNEGQLFLTEEENMEEPAHKKLKNGKEMPTEITSYLKTSTEKSNKLEDFINVALVISVNPEMDHTYI